MKISLFEQQETKNGTLRMKIAEPTTLDKQIYENMGTMENQTVSY